MRRLKQSHGQSLIDRRVASILKELQAERITALKRPKVPKKRTIKGMQKISPGRAYVFYDSKQRKHPNNRRLLRLIRIRKAVDEDGRKTNVLEGWCQWQDTGESVVLPLTFLRLPEFTVIKGGK